MARKKKTPTNGFTEYKKLFLHQFTEHTKALVKIEHCVDQLRKDVLETAIPQIKQDVANVKGQAKVWAIIISLTCGGAVSLAAAFLM